MQLFISLVLRHAIPVTLGFFSCVARLRKITRVQGLWVSVSLLIVSLALIAMGVDPLHLASYAFVVSLLVASALSGLSLGATKKKKSKS